MTLILDGQDETTLLACPLFGDLDRETALWLLDTAQTVRHAEGGLLFSQGEPAERFFVVLAGRVHLFALSETGDQSIIEVIEPGFSFAEGAIFGLGHYPLHAEMVAETRLLAIPGGSFLRRLVERPGLAVRLLASLAAWQRRLMAEITALKSRSPAQRLGLFLLALAPGGAEAAGAIQLPLTKGELASRIGITPESLSRAMARLRPLGVASHGRQISIADPQRLRLFCGGE